MQWGPFEDSALDFGVSSRDSMTGSIVLTVKILMLPFRFRTGMSTLSVDLPQPRALRQPKKIWLAEKLTS